MIEAIRPGAETVDLLDQRLLPDRVEYVRCRRAEDVVALIQALAVRGAPLIGIAGLYAWWLEARALRDQAAGWETLMAAKETIARARPTAVNLRWALDRAAARVVGLTGPDLAAAIRREADLLAQEERARSHAMAVRGASLLGRGSRVLTHCNTGSLATAGVGTALGVIREGYRTGAVSRVWVDETRPLLQGARLTAWELLQDGIPATLITDSMAGFLMARGEVDAVVVGADRIAANGDTANKIGTYALAVLAHHHRIPFYVVAPMSTLDLARDAGSDIPIEERDGSEVRTVRGVAVAPLAVEAYNPAFDVTPGSLITAIVTDRGLAYPPYRETLAQLQQSSANGGNADDAGY
ncbi:MAG: S-methyl-5-thioribose-1-phosphate isomerase [Firmicutes bacterium]|nr:S-methyl-5-thioribose-1-phosphate isomerase [Bacillota bacterium]